MVISKIQRIYLAVAGAGPDQSSVRPSGRNRERKRRQNKSSPPTRKVEEEEENKTEFQFVAFSVIRLASAIIQFSRFVELTQVSINLPGTTQLRRSSTVVYNPPSTCATIAEKTWRAIGLFIVALR